MKPNTNVCIAKTIRCEVCGMPYDFEQYDECPYCKMPDDWAERFDYNWGFDI